MVATKGKSFKAEEKRTLSFLSVQNSDVDENIVIFREKNDIFL